MSVEPGATSPPREESAACPRCAVERWSTRRSRLRVASIVMLTAAALVGVGASVTSRRAAAETDALLASIAAVGAADVRSRVLIGVVAANTRCAPGVGPDAASVDASLYDLWTTQLRCPPSAEAAMAGASQWDAGADFWQSHRGPRRVVALRAGLVALALDRQQCPAWSASARALDLYGNAASAEGACVRYSDIMAEFLRDKVMLVRAADGRPARFAAAGAVALALAAVVAALGARRLGRRVQRLLDSSDAGPYRSVPSHRCERHRV